MRFEKSMIFRVVSSFPNSNNVSLNLNSREQLQKYLDIQIRMWVLCLIWLIVIQLLASHFCCFQFSFSLIFCLLQSISFNHHLLIESYSMPCSYIQTQTFRWVRLASIINILGGRFEMCDMDKRWFQYISRLGLNKRPVSLFIKKYFTKWSLCVYKRVNITFKLI